MDARTLRLLTAITCLAMSGSLTGCVSLGKTNLWGQQAEVVKDDKTGDPQSAATAGKFVVELRDSEGRGSSAEFSLAGPINIHEALQQAGTVKKFNRIKIELVRPLPGGGWHRMPVEYDRGLKRVPAECDYAVLPGDRIIVSEDTSNILTDMLNQAKDANLMGKQKSGKTKSGTFRVAG